MKKLINGITILIMMWACMPGLVSAHAYIAQSSPYQDAELTESPTAIRITFTEKIDTKLSNISLQRTDNGAAIAGSLSGEGDLTLIYTIPKLDKGIYQVSWQVLSLDSHMTDGTFQFAVGVKLEAAKPDETVSLDGNTAGSEGSTGSGSGSGAAAADKPSASAKPKPTKAPSTVPGTTAKPKPHAAPAPAVSAAPSSPVVQDSSDEPAVEPDKAADAANDASSGGSEPAYDLTGNEAADPEDDAAEFPDAESAPPQAESGEVAAAGNHSGHGEHSGSSPAEEGEHDHAGGQGLMAALRVLDILAGVLIAGMMFFRYVIWRDDEEEAPFGFSLRAERLFIGAAALIWILSGVTRLSMLSDQFGGASIYMLASGTMIGKVATLRPALALFALLLSYAPNRERLWANRMKFAAAAALIVTFPLTGHAYAAVKDAALAVALHTVHMSAAAIWFGGLAGLLSLTFYRNAMDRLNQAAVRFSIWALPSIVIILISGIWLSAARLSAWGQLVSTAYGKLIMAKAFFMLLVLAIAALHKLVFMPQIAKATAVRGLLLGVRIEVMLAVALFVLAGWLSSTPPPAAEAAQKLSEPIYWHVMGEKAHMSLRISADEKTEEQAVRLDVWLPEGLGAPVSAAAVVTAAAEAAEEESGKTVTIPLVLQPAAAELFEYPGFTKYTYLASGEFIDDKQSSLITVDLIDEKGGKFHYEREIGGQPAE